MSVELAPGAVPVLICPDCGIGIASVDVAQCEACGWTPILRGRVPDFLSTPDRSGSFQDYVDNYDEIAEADLRDSIQPEEYLEVQTDRLLGYLGDLKGLDVCEVGIGRGLLLDRLLETEVRSVTAVDIAASLMGRHADREQLRVLRANAERLPFRDEFDLLVAADILEHVLNVGDALISINRSMRMGGRLVVKVPLKEDLLQYAQQGDCPWKYVHLRNFTRGSLMSLLGYGGFRLESIRYDGFWRDRLRSFFKQPVAHRAARAFLGSRYPTERAVHGINRRLGRILFRPAEIIAIAQKHEDLDH